MRVISWNINSVRLRAPLVEKLIAEAKPDVICLQETKCPNDSFPKNCFTSSGIPISQKTALRDITVWQRWPACQWLKQILSPIATAQTGAY